MPYGPSFVTISTNIQICCIGIISMGNENVLQVNSNNWESEVLKSEKPVFVDFWAEWCGPCRMVGPVVEQIAQSHSDKIKVVKLNVDENQDIAMKYGIQSIPSLMVFNKGKEVNRTVGAAPKETYLRFINDSISK
jgi:thioredoxin 1